MSAVCVRTNVLDIDSVDNLNFLKDNLKDLIMTKCNLEKNKYFDLSDKTIYLALQPIFNYNNDVIYYQILARTHNKEIFPFDWYKELSKQERINFTVKCALLSNYLEENDISSKFVIQECDFISVKKIINIKNYEISKYGQGLNQKILYNEEICNGGSIYPLDNESPILDMYHQLDTDYYDFYIDNSGNLQYCKTILDKYKGCAISNCFSINKHGEYDDDRSYERIIKLIKDQSNIVYDNLSDKPVHIIKIDNTIAYKAFNYGRNVNKYSEELSKAIDTIWTIDPDIIFVIKCTIPNENYIRVKSIYKALQEKKNDKVLIQGSVLKDYAFRVIMNYNNDIKIEK
tara:strand:+ start:9127 stop:10158 length:1032 start_codon:yes stop_codon:yes gene_type:complete